MVKKTISATHDSKHELLGPGGKHARSIRVLSRVLTWTEDGITYEADQRRADIVVSEMGFTGAKSVNTPHTPEDADKVLADVGEELPPKEAAQYRALAARLNYLALDRADVQFATKEVARHMASPSQGHLLLLKRVARYLLGAPRLVHTFAWQ